MIEHLCVKCKERMQGSRDSIRDGAGVEIGSSER